MAQPGTVRPKSKLEQLMEKDKVFEKQKAERAAASASANNSHSDRKDEPWLSEDIVVKVPKHAVNAVTPVHDATSFACKTLICIVTLP